MLLPMLCGEDLVQEPSLKWRGLRWTGKKRVLLVLWPPSGVGFWQAFCLLRVVLFSEDDSAGLLSLAVFEVLGSEFSWHISSRFGLQLLSCVLAVGQFRLNLILLSTCHWLVINTNCWCWLWLMITFFFILPAFSEKYFTRYICYFCNPVKHTFSLWENVKSKPVWEQGIKLSSPLCLSCLPVIILLGTVILSINTTGCFYIWLLLFWRDLPQCTQPSLGREAYEIAPNGTWWFFPSPSPVFL